MRRLIFVLLLSLTACAHGPYQGYEGPPLPDSAQSRVSGESEKNHTVMIGWDERVLITAINGKATGVLGMARTYPDTVNLKPGDYTLKVMYNYRSTYAHSQVRFEAKAGRSYIIRKHIDGLIAAGSQIRFWVEEDAGAKAGQSL